MAEACMYVPKQNPEKIASAPVAFVGTVVAVRLPPGSVFVPLRAIFKVQKAIRGVKDGQLYEAEGYMTSCHNDFRVNERYLYLGSSLPSDTLRLAYADGKPQSENIDFVIRETGIQEAKMPLDIFPCIEHPPTLQGITYKDKNNWLIWLNGKKVTPEEKPEEITEIFVKPDVVQLKWKIKCSNKMYSLRLKPAGANYGANPSSNEQQIQCERDTGYKCHFAQCKMEMGIDPKEVGCNPGWIPE